MTLFKTFQILLSETVSLATKPVVSLTIAAGVLFSTQHKQSYPLMN